MVNLNALGVQSLHVATQHLPVGVAVGRGLALSAAAGVQSVEVGHSPAAAATSYAAPTVVTMASLVGANDIVVAAGTSAAALQSLINSAAAGSVIRLDAGHFAFDRTVTIDRSDITVIGAGSDKTVIDVPPGLGAEAFHIGNATRSGSYALAADVASGSNVLTLNAPSNLVAGDYIYITRASTTAFYDSIGDTAFRDLSVPLRNTLAQVQSVSGNTITLAAGVKFDYVPNETTISKIAIDERVTVGGFSVSYGLAAANPSNFTNTLSAYDRDAVIQVEGTAGLHLFDITAHDVPSMGVNVASSTGAYINGMTMTGAHNKGDNGNGYALQIRDVFDSTFVGLTDQDMRHSVVFASYTSSAGNYVHVLQTDRDINFHGGRDHDTVVVVDVSIRDANSDIIGSSSFFNMTGTHYGSATDPTTNIISFGRVVGTRLNDDVRGFDTGSWLEGAGGNDKLTGGSGNDRLSGGTGNDTINGGAGVDIATYSGLSANYAVTKTASGFTVAEKLGVHATDVVSGVEWLLFDDRAMRLSDMTLQPVTAVTGIFAGVGTAPADPVLPSGSPPPPPPPPPPPILPPPSPPQSGEIFGTSSADVFNVTAVGTIVHGLGGTDTVNATVSFTMLSDVENLNLIGTAAINATGSDILNLINGNDAANQISGMGGLDKLFGMGGDDHIFGGDGADSIEGGLGNDLIEGGLGRDKMMGGAGADVFVFKSAADTTVATQDYILDFQTGIDSIDLSAIDANSLLAGDQAFKWCTGPSGAGSVWVVNFHLYADINGDGLADLGLNVARSVVATDLIL